MEDLRQALEEAEVENYQHKTFIPFRTLETIVTEDAVHRILRSTQIPVYDHAEITRTVVSRGIRLFATLVMVGDVTPIQKFFESDHSIQPDLDSKLPLKQEDMEGILEKPKKRAIFVRKQWMFMSPFIQADQTHRCLHEYAIIPFKQKHKIGGGGFAEVFRVNLIAGQHNIGDVNLDIELACKELRDERRDSQQTYINERHILSLLRCLKHPNIIQLITAFTASEPTHNIYSFLFPLAEGDLKKFFESERRLPGFEEDSDIFNALCRVSSALAAVHGYFAIDFNLQKIGCHYDIKPRNILFRKGDFLLSDFGLSRLRETTEDSKSRFQDVEGDYVAPECENKELQHAKGEPGRKSDIWSFGCILSEMLAYLHDGPQCVKSYRQSRRTAIGTETGSFFYSLGPSENDGVNKILHTEFRSDSLCSLKVLVNQCVKLDMESRPSASHIASRLFSIAQKPLVDHILANLKAGCHEFELDAELQRFQIWTEFTGFSTENTDSVTMESPFPSTSWLSKDLHHHQYHLMLNTLADLAKETAEVAIIAQSPEHPPYRYCYHMQRLQDTLWGFHGPSTLQQMDTRLQSILVDKVSKEAIGEASALVPRIHASSYSDKLTGDQYRRIRLLGAIKSVAQMLETQPFPGEDMLMPISDLAIKFKPFGYHHLSTYLPSEEKVLVETMVYSESWVARIEELIERVRSIVALRSKHVLGDIESVRSILPILESKGYFHDPSRHRFGIVYTLPYHPPGRFVMTLWDMINGAAQQKTISLKHPPMSMKFTLASKLVTSVANLHTAGWFHKNINSFNIIVHTDNENMYVPSVDAAYLIGFNYSRLNSENAFTEGPEHGEGTKDYQHPQYLKTKKSQAKDSEDSLRRFRPEFEYYSTGLVLLEIALWQPLSKMIKDWKAFNSSQVTRALIKHHVPLARIFMGDQYADAVEKCLSVLSKSSIGIQFMNFEKEVLQPIQQRLV